mgnify:CR=1 FL=1
MGFLKEYKSPLNSDTKLLLCLLSFTEILLGQELGHLTQDSQDCASLPLVSRVYYLVNTINILTILLDLTKMR